MEYSFYNNENKLTKVKLVFDHKWSEYTQNNPELASIFSKIDINQDGLVDYNEASMFRKLMQLADSFIDNVSGDKVIQPEELELLINKIKSNEIDFNKLLKENVSEHWDVGYEDSDAHLENITSKIKFNNPTDLEVEIFDTKRTVEMPLEPSNKTSNFREYQLNITDKDGKTKKILLNFPTDNGVETDYNVIKQIIEGYNDKVLKKLASETDGIFFKNSKLLFDYRGGYFLPSSNNEYIMLKLTPNNLFKRNEPREIQYPEVLVHELGHASDLEDDIHDAKAKKLFDDVKNTKFLKKDYYAMKTERETYAELFKGYHIITERIKGVVQSNPALVDKFNSEEELEAYVSDLAVNYMLDLSSNSQKAYDSFNGNDSSESLSKDNNFVDIDKKINKELKPYIKEDLKYIKMFSKAADRKPSTKDAYTDLLHQIVNDYNNSDNGKKLLATWYMWD